MKLQPPRPARPMTYAELVAALGAHDASAAKHATMVKRLAEHGPTDSEVQRYSDEGRAALRSTKSGSLALDIVETLTPVLAEMQQRIAKLEQQPCPQWAGPFKSGTEYKPLSFTVHGGALWLSQRSTSDRPGSGDAWTLCCKSGSHNGR